MFKRLLVLLIALVPLAAFGGVLDRDIVLTDDGTLYTVESTYANVVPNLQTSSERVLTLTVQKDSTTTTTVIPATLSGGWHVYPALAYDSQSKTLFVFWEAARNNFTSSDLYVCAYQNGTWDNARSLDSAQWAVRQNLRIAITRTTEQTDFSGNTTVIPEINVHAVWWEDNGGAEWARYAMITVQKGVVLDPLVQDLSAFPNANAPVTQQPRPDVSRELLRHPAVVETRGHDSVDILYGDMNALTLRRTTIRPTIQGRLRVPVGHTGAPLPGPSATVKTTSPIDTLVNGDNVAFYYDGDTQNSLSYLLYTNGAWSTVRSLSLNEKLSRDSAVTALQKLITAQ
jgi:hypothetical protein